MYRLLRLLENFLSTVKWLEHNVTYVAKNIEMDLRYITWIDHDRGASFVPFVSEHSLLLYIIYYYYYYIVL